MDINERKQYLESKLKAVTTELEAEGLFLVAGALRFESDHKEDGICEAIHLLSGRVELLLAVEVARKYGYEITKVISPAEIKEPEDERN